MFLFFFCCSSGKEHVDTTPNGGLLKPELMELLWTLYPPEPTGLPPRHKSSWMRPIVNGEEFADIAGDLSKVCTSFLLFI